MTYSQYISADIQSDIETQKNSNHQHPLKDKLKQELFESGFITRHKWMVWFLEDGPINPGESLYRKRPVCLLDPLF